MAITIPATWEKYSTDKDSVTYRMSSHTHSRPWICIFKRTVGNTADPVTSKYQVKFVRGVDETFGATTDGAYPNTIIELNVRNVDGQTPADLDQIATDLSTFLADQVAGGFVDAVTETLDIPLG